MLAIPNFSEGLEAEAIATIARALTAGSEGVRLLDTHSDPDHNRTVYTLAAAAGPAGPASLVESLFAGAAVAAETLDIAAHSGWHPRVGALDVAPLVYLEDAERGAACAAALLLADRLGNELEIPVFLYGLLTDGRVARSQIRRGGPATLETAREIAARIREGGPEGLPSVRAIGLTLPRRGGVAQVSTNVEDYRRTSLARVVEAISRHAAPLRAEVVGLPPRAAFEGFPEALPVTNRRYLEDALAATPDPPAVNV